MKVGNVLRIPLLLCRRVTQHGAVALRVSQIADHQLVDELRIVHGEPPRNGSTPIVTNEGDRVDLQVLDHSFDIRHEMGHGVVFHAFGLAALVVGACVHSDGLIVVGKSGHLFAPGVPKIGKAMDKENNGAFAQGDVVECHPVVIRLMVLNAVEYIRLDVSYRGFDGTL